MHVTDRARCLRAGGEGPARARGGAAPSLAAPDSIQGPEMGGGSLTFLGESGTAETVLWNLLTRHLGVQLSVVRQLLPVGRTFIGKWRQGLGSDYVWNP